MSSWHPRFHVIDLTCVFACFLYVFERLRSLTRDIAPLFDRNLVLKAIAWFILFSCLHRARYKLEAAVEKLNVDVVVKVAPDSGLSTGGFTDCLLQYGASHVYGVDVGYGQVAHKIRRDEHVTVIEWTNVRYLLALPQQVGIVTLDLSVISILLVWFRNQCSVISNSSFIDMWLYVLVD
ncbi:hypothetical protein Cni_G11442 [Canna indica]|uniref:Ribosomal RNA methyltransferase FtsJ domain-containing protein n=1 Tax=Canna indica TaxID=4628 RepID=A0AAQ3K8R9_9LILI|nr:hypothetical protein Cni_G11442 [Canna indica]